MRAYYATYNDKVYQLLSNNMVPSSIMNTAVYSHSEVSHMRDRRAANVKLTISNTDSSAPSNKEVFESVVSKLKTDKTTSIERLSDVYRIYTEYSLVDDVSKSVVDEGVGITEVKPDAFIFPLGITTENEFVSRLGISIHSKCEKVYRDVRPFGIMRTTVNSRFILYINRIYILQLTMNAFSITEVSNGKNAVPYIQHPTSYVGNYPYDPTHWACPSPCASHGVDHRIPVMNHPSIPTVAMAQTINLRENDYIMMYDTMKEGLVFDPIVIDYKPVSISIDVNFSFLDVLVAAQEEIDAILEENKKEEETTIDPPTGDGEESGTGSETENPSGKDNIEEPEEVIKNPSTGEEVTDPSTETGSDTSETTDETEENTSGTIEDSGESTT